MSASRLRIVQISDFHLFADAEGTLFDVVTRPRLEAVLAAIAEGWSDFDRLIITGDLAHDECAPTYRVIREMLGPWLPRCRVVPGNHDNRPAIAEVLGELLDPHPPGGNGAIAFAEVLNGWQLIGLDSHVPGESYGCIDATQLSWLCQRLRETPDRPTLLFLHHPPLDVGVPWLDCIGLENAADLAETVIGAPHVRAILTGHVHQAFQGTLGTTPVLSCPSTAVQFRPRAQTFETDTLPPAFCVLELEGDEFRHEVVRLVA